MSHMKRVIRYESVRSLRYDGAMIIIKKTEAINYGSIIFSNSFSFVDSCNLIRTSTQNV